MSNVRAQGGNTQWFELGSTTHWVPQLDVDSKYKVTPSCQTYIKKFQTKRHGVKGVDSLIVLLETM